MFKLGANDPRMVRARRWLHMLSLDESPKLLNKLDASLANRAQEGQYRLQRPRDGAAGAGAEAVHVEK